ncbi:MAG: ribonuclease Y [bacterium]
MPQVPAYVIATASAILFFCIGWLVNKYRGERADGRARDVREKILEEAKREAKTIRKSAEIDAKEEFFRARKEFADETEQLRRENNRRQETLDQRETNLNKKVSFIDKKEARLEVRDDELKQKLAAVSEDQVQLQRIIGEQNQKLEHIAGLSAENAKRMLMENLIADAKHSAAKSIKQVREDAERHAKRESQKILSLAIQRYAADHVAEESISVVDLPNDEMKGRIIGREGRNIRAFELATGVDVIIDDTPEAVIVSGFDPVRREIAKLSLQKLIRDGRIHPGRIEEVVKRTETEMMERIREIGEQACLDLGVQNINPELLGYIGRLQYRTSYGQNLLLHSKEVAAVAATIASELGLDPKLAKRCGFLHDIGKSADHEIEGPHALIGAHICKKFGENDFVLNAVGGHHLDVEATSPFTYITAAADAVSASRPGARRESLETYIKRLENLEQIATSFEGVEKSYAIQAGREIRILVNHTKVSDADAALLAEEVSRRVEGELEYPGQIKVMVIRETRATAYAR